MVPVLSLVTCIFLSDLYYHFALSILASLLLLQEALNSIFVSKNFKLRVCAYLISSQRITCGSQFSPCNTCVLGTELRVSVVADSYPLSHLAGPVSFETGSPYSLFNHECWDYRICSPHLAVSSPI